jgi:lipid II:glycine glycyltransferase (peptidoglycan interpeptide bridge formation enzyme)
MQVRDLSAQEYQALLIRMNANPPIEQLPVWQEYEATIPDRTFWGYCAIEASSVEAVCAFMDYKTHGYHFLRAHHAPVWAQKPSASEEQAALESLRTYARKKDKRLAFIRLCVLHELPLCRPVLSSVPYDATVIVDLRGGDEQILARMKPRGRRDVRKALRECNCTFADETEQAAACFDEYYYVMRQTAERDGFSPAPESNYTEMMRCLGPDSCRLYVARSKEDHSVVCWEMDTISGTRAVRYYAATLSGKARNHVADALVYYALCELGRRGCLDMDLMAIGSDFSPSLKGLNEFKCKFAKEAASVAPDRDLPLRPLLYEALEKVKSLKGAARTAPGAE